jgi:uncharacterized protein (DUF1015 family)
VHLKNKDFKRISKAAVFVYEITSSFGVHLGFIAQTDLQEFISKNIKPHEKTLKLKEKISKDLLLNRAAMVKPVLVCHLPNNELTELLKSHRDHHPAKLTVQLSKCNDVHRIWPIYDLSTVKQIQHLAGSVDHAYIADGHHRSKVLQKLDKTSKSHHLNVERVCSAYFDFNAVQILDYNRMVEIGSRISLCDFILQLEKIFTVKKSGQALKAGKKHHLSMLLDGQWYSLSWKPGILKKYRKQEVILDHQVFDKEVLNKILRIKNVQNDKSITYFSGEKSLHKIESKLAGCPRTAAFFICPVEIGEMVQLTENDKTLPPKSTYFVPRLNNGIICDEF